MTDPSEGMEENDARVLSSISSNPLGSLTELARSSEMTVEAFSERTKSLGKRGILYPGFARAEIACSAVGLEHLIVLADVFPAHRATFEAACDVHPYSQYRIRCIGRLHSSNFFTQFSIPYGTKSRLVAFLEALQQEGIVAGFSLWAPVARPARTEYDIKSYEAAKRTWVTDWKTWEYAVETAPTHVEALPPSILHLLHSRDMRVLRLLSIDARMEKRKIADKVGMSDHVLSRRLALYRKHDVIEGYRVVHDRNISGYAVTVAISARATLALTEKLFAGFAALHFPGVFIPLEKGFFYLGNVPPKEMVRLQSSLEEYCEHIELTMCEYKSSMRYHFDAEPSNYKEGFGWKDAREYMVEQPMSAVRAAVRKSRRQNETG